MDVANAGFPGWTSLESLISLETRDLDLGPDLVVVCSGVNDLQPAGHVPFTPDYSAGHAEILPRVLGVTPVPVRLVSRSVFLESVMGRLRAPGAAAPAEGFAPSWEWTGGPKRDDIPQAAVDVYERNLRSTAAAARARGARTLFVAQSARLRAGHEAEDRAWMEGWAPGLTPAGFSAGLARYNAVARALAMDGSVLYLDPRGRRVPRPRVRGPVHFTAGA